MPQWFIKDRVCQRVNGTYTTIMGIILDSMSKVITKILERGFEFRLDKLL